MKMYKIGEISKICNVPTSSIRFFEEKGILRPQKDKLNNYRYYTVWDINRIFEYRKYRNMGFSLNETIDIIKKSDLNGFSKLLNEKQKEAEKMLQYYEMKAAKLRAHNNIIKKAQFLVENYSIVTRPAHYYYINRYFDGEDYVFLKPEDSDGAIDIFFENYEFADNIYRIKKDWFTGNRELPEFQWGFSIKKQWGDALEIDILPNLEYAPPVKSIYTFIRTTNRIPFSPNMFFPAMEYMKENNYRLAGDVLGNWIATIQEGDQEARYMEVWIPIEEDSDR